MEENIILFLNECGLIFKKEEELNGMVVTRSIFLLPETYKVIQPKIKEMKTKYSSSSLTALQKPAELNQKWPLLNLVRQILRVHKYNMDPFRKSNGSDKNGKKRYKRFFTLRKKY